MRFVRLILIHFGLWLATAILAFFVLMLNLSNHGPVDDLGFGIAFLFAMIILFFVYHLIASSVGLLVYIAAAKDWIRESYSWKVYIPVIVIHILSFSLIAFMAFLRFR